MKQLKVGDVLATINNLKNEGMSLKEIVELPIYIGYDDELNGLHCAWFVQRVDTNNEDDAEENNKPCAYLYAFSLSICRVYHRRQRSR